MASIPFRTMTASNHRSFFEVTIGYYQESTRTTTSYNDQQLVDIMKRVMAIYDASPSLNFLQTQMTMLSASNCGDFKGPWQGSMTRSVTNEESGMYLEPYPLQDLIN